MNLILGVLLSWATLTAFTGAVSQWMASAGDTNEPWWCHYSYAGLAYAGIAATLWLFFTGIYIAVH